MCQIAVDFLEISIYNSATMETNMDSSILFNDFKRELNTVQNNLKLFDEIVRHHHAFNSKYTPEFQQQFTLHLYF